MDTTEARQRLEAELATLTRTDAELERENDRDAGREPTNARQHPADHASEVEFEEETEAFTGEIDDRREQIQAALRRLDEGTYGRCASCGRPISDERLAARPDADRCVDCQRQAEQVSRGG